MLHSDRPRDTPSRSFRRAISWSTSTPRRSRFAKRRVHLTLKQYQVIQRSSILLAEVRDTAECGASWESVAAAEFSEPSTVPPKQRRTGYICIRWKVAKSSLAFMEASDS
jgi:hypothetical protein